LLWLCAGVIHKMIVTQKAAARTAGCKFIFMVANIMTGDLSLVLFAGCDRVTESLDIYNSVIKQLR
jgi:hypothetical protein